MARLCFHPPAGRAQHGAGATVSVRSLRVEKRRACEAVGRNCSCLSLLAVRGSALGTEQKQFPFLLVRKVPSCLGSELEGDLRSWHSHDARPHASTTS